MVDFKTITDLINEDIVTNGKGDIDAVMLRTILLGMLTAVGENLDGKVDAEIGKSLILDTLIIKLSNMPTITGFNATTNHIFIDGKEYELTPYIPIPDYYIGFCDNNTTFSNYSDAQLISNAQYNGIISTTPDYPSASGYVYFGAGQKCMYLLYNVNANLRVDIDNPGGTAFDLEDQTPEQIDIFNHANVVSNGRTYRVVATYDVNNSQENGFRFKFN